MKTSTNKIGRLWVACAAASGSMLAAHAAHAADCSTLPNPVYVTGSSAVQPFLAGIGTVLAAGSTPVTIVYKKQGSCTGGDAIVNGTKMTGTATYWAANSSVSGETCDLPTTGQSADVGVSDVFWTSCAGSSPLASDVGDFFGPVQVMTFVVPKASSHQSISAEAAYLTFGLGQAGKSPWDDETVMWVRNAQSGTQSMIATAIKVPPTKFKGNDSGGSSGVLTNVSSATSVDKAIGILSTGEADDARDKIRELAYQHYGQSCGFWPDSSATSFDKMNVRDGHYPIWGPLHLFAHVDSSGKPTNPEAATLIDYVSGAKQLPGANLIDVVINAHLVPQCAMQVTRTSEIGALASYQPAEPCGCYFDKKTTGTTSCTACTKDSDCSTNHCRNGYCEAN
jgi:ABC-type phosphate transport system substrate-binding protein